MEKWIYKIIFIAVLVGTILASSFTLAADLTRVTVSLSAQMINEASNTTIRFRTPTGVDASTDTITIAWPDGFDVSSLVLTDLDLSHGAVSGYETDETLAAAAGVGIWGAAWAGQTLTLTAPTDAAAGEIGVNDYVVLEAGTQASFGGAGANQAVNPGTQGSYGYFISGTFGDTKYPAVYIADNNTVAITGTVPGAVETICDNGLDDDGDTFIDCADSDCVGSAYCAPPGGGDTTPPVLSDIRCMDVTPTSFNVAWTTNEAATSCSEYGETSIYELGMLCNMSLVWSHSIPLVGLTPLTDYHFRVISRDQYFNTALSGDYVCTTAGDTDAPVISNVRAMNIGCDSAEIFWDTNEPATTQVDYGLTSLYGIETPTDFTYATEHHVILSGLAPDTDYHFRVRSYDLSGNGAVSGDNSFRTGICAEFPLITNLRCENITDMGFTVAWDTNEPASSRVVYGETTSYEIGDVANPAFVTAHSMAIAGLLPATDYHSRAYSTDPDTNQSISDDLMCTTLPTACIIDCSRLLYDLYIVNPDMTERHMYTEYTLIEDRGSGIIRVYFEDKGLDFDYNDIVVDMNLSSCENVTIDVISYNADWTHEVRMKLDYGGNIQDFQLWPDSHLVVGESRSFNVRDYPALCALPPDTIPPANVTDFTATVTGPLEITLDWINPLDIDFAGVRICRSTVAYPTDPLTCDVIYEGPGNTFIDTDVLPGVTYYYTNFAFDTYLNFASGAIASARIPLPVEVTFLGHPEKRWPRTGNWDTIIEMELRDPGTLASLETISFATDALGYGTSTMGMLEYGKTYDFTAKGLSHLRKKMSSAVLTEAATMLDFTFGNTFNLYAGDCHPSKDNYVNSLDISTLLNDLMASDQASDLNNDSQVNSLDITIQMANLMKPLGDE